MTILEVQGVYKDFKGLKVLNDVNLAVEEGECHAIIGPNGAGKSTLFNVITGKYQPTKGKIHFNEEDITGLSPYRIASKGLARSFQITNVFPGMTVYANVRNAVLSKRKIRFNCFVRLDKIDSVRQETLDLITTLGLDSIRDVPASELSYGQQRALEIGISLATKGKTVMVVEHDMDVVFSMADRITVLSYGEVLASGSPEEIRGNERVKRAYLGKKEHA
jgi:branched-chain amino acid transport system ATP-binding protein